MSSNSNNILKGEVTCVSHKRKAGRTKFKETRHPVYHGVRERDGSKWVCEIREPNKKSRIWLGTYPSAELAAMAHDVAALALRGERAALNFPDSAWLAPQAKSTSAQDIRLAALQATRSEFLSSKIICSSCENKSHEEDKESCTNDDLKCLDEEDKSKELFLDEEEIFNMPSLIDGMAEGMLLTPPSLKRGFGWDGFDDYANTSYIDLELW